MTNKHTPTGPKYIYQETVDTLCSQSCVFVSRREGKMRSRLKTLQVEGKRRGGEGPGGREEAVNTSLGQRKCQRHTWGKHREIPGASCTVQCLKDRWRIAPGQRCFKVIARGAESLPVVEGDFCGNARWGRAQCAFVDEKLMICANCEGKLMCLCKVVCFAGVDPCPRWQRSIFHMEINAKLFQKSCFCWTTTVGWKMGR